MAIRRRIPSTTNEPQGAEPHSVSALLSDVAMLLAIGRNATVFFAYLAPMSVLPNCHGIPLLCMFSFIRATVAMASTLANFPFTTGVSDLVFADISYLIAFGPPVSVKIPVLAATASQ